MAKKMTDLTGDGKVTRADVLKGRGVPGFAKGKGTKRYAEGGNVEDVEMVVTGNRPKNQGFSFPSNMGNMPANISYNMPTGGPPAPSSGDMAALMNSPMAPPSRNKLQVPIARTGPRGAGYLGPTYRGEGGERVSAGVGPRGSFGVGASMPFKKGGAVKKMAKGGSTASKRGDGCAIKGKTKGRIV
jgi:hypothetical protein